MAIWRGILSLEIKNLFIMNTVRYGFATLQKTAANNSCSIKGIKQVQVFCPLTVKPMNWSLQYMEEPISSSTRQKMQNLIKTDTRTVLNKFTAGNRVNFLNNDPSGP